MDEKHYKSNTRHRNDDSIDWEQRRYEIAASMIGQIYLDTSPQPCHKVICAEIAIEYAEELIKQLKEKADE